MTEHPRDAVAAERRVDGIAERFVDDSLALDPLLATDLGVREFEDRLPDLSPEGFAAREQLTRSALRSMESADPVDDRESLAKDAFVERLGVSLERYDAGTVTSQISVIYSELHRIREAFDLMSFEGEEGWTNVDARLRAIPEALDGYRETLSGSAARGNVSAKRQIAAVAHQLRTWTGQEGAVGDFFRNLVEGAQVAQALGSSLADSARGASDAYARFARYLDDDLLPQGRDRDAVGREKYGPESRFYLGADVDLDETYAWGWSELERIEDEMRRVANDIVAGGTVDDAVVALDADPARVVSGRLQFRDWMQALADRAISELADVHFDIPEPVRTIECCLAPTNDGGIYYTEPSEDFSRPGRMWWSVPDGIDDFSTWREVTTVFHEGVPGHHLQVGQTAYRSELLNRWQRRMCWVSGHGEGWALYAERLMDELGYLGDPGDRLGMLDGQGFRAARVVIDIGMHLELRIPRDNPFGFHPGETWTPQLGLEFMRQHCRMDDAFIRFEVDRYLGWPGQAPSYKVGERIWMQARDDARRRRGASFDLKDFHRQALDLGSIGLDPLREALQQL